MGSKRSVALGGEALLDVGNLDGVAPGLDEDGDVVVAGGGGKRDLVVHAGDNLLLDADDSAELDVLLPGELMPGLILGLLEHIALQQFLHSSLGHELVAADLGYFITYELGVHHREQNCEHNEQF